MYSLPSISANWFPAPTTLLCSRDTVFTRPREDVCASSYDGSAGCVQPLDGTAVKLHQTELSKNGSQSHRLRPGRRYDMDQPGFLPDQVNILLFSITQHSIKNLSFFNVSFRNMPQQYPYSQGQGSYYFGQSMPHYPQYYSMHPGNIQFTPDQFNLYMKHY